MAHRITLVPGDGTGPEIVEATRRVVDHLGAGIDWELQEAGLPAQEQFGSLLPEHTLESIKRNKVCLKGPITTPIGSGFRSVNVGLRHALNLYACLRPCKYYPGIIASHKNVDIVVVRENIEDLYAGIEFERGTPEALRLIKFLGDSMGQKIREDSGVGIKPISDYNSTRIIKFAFDYARENGRKKVTAITKANIMKFTDGLFLEMGRKVAQDYPGIQYEEMLVDNTCMQLVRRPDQFDVLVLPNLYGDILSDLCAGLVGGLGVAPGANIGDNVAVFEATHGSAPRYAGQNRVNPMAVMFSAVLMLRYIGERAAGDRMEEAMAQVIAEGKSVTYDMKSHRDDPTAVGTSQVADAIIAKLDRM